ncbi:MAG TPA: RNA polymerase sigma factor [Pyrinomonadaceae bacterium]|nr:RNA polymerase sigma factor [Pyrinomonadaceae bacterium]
MLDQRRVAAQPEENREQSFREQLFTERYANLRLWAIRLTNQESAADDLVQDAFVQWMLGRTRLEEIENIDGYLRTMLRNMHFSRVSRAAQRLHETELSIADYDSGLLGWAAIEPPRRLQASEDLHQICAYACFRKESSKAGSVLILRFFHNYFPTEIASVLNSSRNCVDQWQRLARREAKLFMNRPGGLRFVNGEAPARSSVRYLKSDCDLMFDLRQLIFSSCRGDCLSQKELHEAYAGGDDDALTTAKLGHLVSCAKCLDFVNDLLGLPLLAERYRNDSTERKEPPKDANGGGASGGGPTELKSKLARRLRETHEHKPQELRIAVNGLLVGSMKVSAEVSELDLNLAPDDPIEFVEIFSEQGIQLLFLSVNSSGPRYEQWARIELSEGRLLEASYQDESDPSLHVLYNDPAASDSSEVLETNASSSPLTVVPDLDVVRQPNVEAQRGFRALVSKVTDTLRHILSNRTERGSAESGFLSSLDDSRRPSQWHLAFIVLACIVITAAFLTFKASLSRELSATALLERATLAEQAAQKTPDRISHRYINLEERRSTEGAIVARRKIELWLLHANGKSARRLYDDGNHLIAGAWQKSDGSRTVFHHGSKPRSESALATPGDLLLNLEDTWQLEPSAQAFRSLIGELAVVEVEERSTTYVLIYESTRTVGASRLLKATLTLNKSDLHAIEQTLLVQRGNELREYRFVEASSELLPVTAVAPGVFEIEPALTGGTAESGKPGDWASRDLTSSRVPPSPSASAPPAASAELEVDVAYLLNRAKADRNEQVTLTRSVGGSLRVEGIVESTERKQEFLNALAPVSNNPAVKIEIRTVAEAVQRPVVPGSVSIQETEETADVVAAEDELRAYFEKRASSGSSDDAIRKYSSRVVKRAYDALFHAIELKRLSNRFANVDMQTVAPGAREKWLDMLHEHATAFARETAVLRQEIQPVFFPSASAPGSEGGVISSDADLARAIERLHKLALSNNEAVRSAFTTSSQSSAIAVKSSAFWQALFKAEGIAKRIQNYQVG